MFEDKPALPDGTAERSWPAGVLRDLARQAEAGAICRPLDTSEVVREIQAMPPSGAQFLDHDFMLKPEAWANRKH